MDKQIVVCPHNGILLGNEKEWTINTHKNMDKSQGQKRQRKKIVSKDFILDDSIYMQQSKRQN